MENENENEIESVRADLRACVVTLFPEMIQTAASHSILGRAQSAGKLSLQTIDPRDFTANRHRTVDDYPFGGGAGMVMKPEPLARAIDAATEGNPQTPVIYLGPDGEVFTQAIARELSQAENLVFVCGHYEGIDERVRDGWITRTISIGDYVLTGGELPALVLLDAITRLIPGVLGNSESTSDESFSDGLLEYPQYTRPAEFDGRVVPDILLSGHHANVAKWRRQRALVRTRERRPDLFQRILPLSKADQKLLDLFDDAAVRAAEAVQVLEPVSEAAKEIVDPETAGGCAETNSL